MDITAIIRDDTGKEWEETLLNCRDGWPSTVMTGILTDFNATLRMGERPRYLVRIVNAKQSPQKHDWEKSNLVTIIKSGRNYDTAKCKRCGATGKRYGLSADVHPDKRFTYVCNNA